MQDKQPNNKTIRGLTAAEVSSKIEKGEVNKFADNSSRSLLMIIWTNLINLPNLIIFTSIVFLIIYRQYNDALLISGIILLNNLISVIQEVQARNSLAKINLINSQPVQVMRGGILTAIQPEDIVIDDVILLESGKYLYVDGKLLESESLLLDESILTGESDYITKEGGDEVLSGSFVVAGKGFYQATKVGADSYANQITQAAKQYINYLSPLQVYINYLVRILTYLTVAVIILLLSLNFLVLKMDDVTVLNALISVVTAMVPQGIVLTLTLAFTLGVIRMYSQKILVQKASAVETLAGIDVLCMDKTGTLTQNKLELSEFIELAKFEHQGTSYKSSQLLGFFAAETLEQNKTILAISKKYKNEIATQTEIHSQLPFTSKTKSSGIAIHLNGSQTEHDHSQTVLLLLGGLDALEAKIESTQLEQLKKLDAEYAEKGQRNLVFAARSMTNFAGEWFGTEDSDKYQALGFISFEDKLREGAADIINSFLVQGVKPVVISGDSAATVLALTKQLNISTLDRAITGKELSETENKIQLEEAVLGHDIFARVTPEQKLQIIKIYQNNNKRVAMVGDGVNDALAIKQANLGISMASGANVTKSIADVVLLDDDLQRLANVMSEGKEILFNTLRSAQLLLVKNIYSLFIILSSLFFGLAFPFTPRGLFLLAFLNSNLPIFIILAERNPHLKKVEFMRELLSFVIVGGGNYCSIKHRYSCSSGVHFSRTKHWTYSNSSTYLRPDHGHR